MLDIFIDADACPVKEEVYRVAERYGLRVTLVSNAWMRIPQRDWIELVVVDHVATDDIVITGDIPLAARCLGKGTMVIGLTGRPFTEENIGEALATRDLLSQLRDLGTVAGGPPPFKRKDRSRFLQSLDQAIQAVRRRRGQTP